ncbi:MAG: class I SAM-dependent methyltransferase [Candidatus Altiarchaeia archaeon]
MDKQEYYDMYTAEERHWWFKGRRTMYLSVLNRFFRSCKDLDILDFGCGTGRNIEELRKYGKVTGVDISQDSYYLCKKRGLDIRLVDILKDDAKDILNDRFDLITCFDVLEHLQDAGKTVGRLGDFLTDGGYILATVPAHPFLWSNHDVILQHKRRYEKKGLREEFEKNNFEVVFISYYNSLIFPVALMRQIINPRRTSTAGTDIGLLNSILPPFYVLESRLAALGAMPFGVSLICLARKKARR